MYRVEIWEYEAGWGSRYCGSKVFDTKAKAEEFIEEYNSVNDLPEVPDWYMAAQGPYFTTAP